MDERGLNDLLARLPALRIGVIGDFCLDAYWTLDLSASEPSLETGLPTRPIRKQSYSLGGAGNVVHNLAALGVGSVSVFGVVGDDPFGWALERRLEEIRAGTAGLLRQRKEWATPVYIKPLLQEREESRLDFGDYNRLADDTARRLLALLEEALPALDAVIINEQLHRGLHTEPFQKALADLVARNPEALFVADCRHLSGVYEGCIRKLNACEAARLAGERCEPDDVIPLARTLAQARSLQRGNRPLFISRGARGCVIRAAAGEWTVPGLHIVGRTDPVGAGDSMTAGIAAGLAAGRPPLEAAEFGNFVAGVTVQKRFQTGTATPDEIRAIGGRPDYVYQPELADDPRGATLLPDSDIEVVEQRPAGGRIAHVIFDHDGTLSTLREGWESVMEPMMIRAILGPRYASAGEDDYARVVARVRDYIDRTTGIQTLEQMRGLTEMVRESGFVPPAGILDEAGYKRIYNEALLGIVKDRLARLDRGERDVTDFTLKGAVAFLRRLHAAGIRLHLASGTDRADVEREARALGYADLFEGRIHGAVGDLRQEAKRMVLERILAELGPAGRGAVATFGDGPVEIRETRKRGGLAIGVASDEWRRFGPNPAKRRRLIKAGAHYVIPDFSRPEPLLRLLGA